MIDRPLVLFASQLAQAVAAVVLALVLARFYRLYGRDYLRTWSRSWWALCAYEVLSGAALALSRMSPASPLRIAVSGLSLIAAYWQVGWLLLGTYEVVTDTRLERRKRHAILGTLAALAVVSVIGSIAVSPAARLVMRVGVRPLFLAIAFLGASYGLLRASRGVSGLGRRIVAVSALLYGLQQIPYLVLILVWAQHPASSPFAMYLAPFDFLFLAIMGLGMVIWLLEEERARLLTASARIEHLAFHDSLTDLPNRNRLLQHLAMALRRAGRRRGRLAVLFLDLDRFKMINDSLGHGSGDELVQIIAQRLQGCLRSTDTLARVAADEFAILIPAVDGDVEVQHIAERLLAVIRRPFSIQTREIYMTASLGVSRFPEDGDEAEDLLKKADVAMHRAKEQGRDRHQIYAPSMDEDTLDRLALENDLRKAVENGEMVLHYQPVVGAGSARVCGFEALLRWQHPQRGLLAPGGFLGLAEASGLSSSIDFWVLRAACREVASWHAGGGADAGGLRVAVNLSARTFQHPGLLEHVRKTLAETGIAAPALELEITETLAMENAGATLAVLRGLKDLGVRLSIDDFGTGYSSLSYLTDFPIDTLKIDRSFVSSLTTNRGSVEVAAAIIALAHSLEIAVVAEGVEEQEQWGILREKGCDELQGYLFGRPVPSDECLTRWRSPFPQTLASPSRPGFAEALPTA
ncbi:MAG TPA: EAL domain-containing protein [Thermoanaerobaculia bacterium]|nr:EAL domain-containing protein [Thermoanaerobaculia bacterium]